MGYVLPGPLVTQVVTTSGAAPVTPDLYPVFLGPAKNVVELTLVGSFNVPSAPVVEYPTQPEPTADFSGTPLSGYAPLQVVFTNLSTNATTYAWDFKNDTTATSSATNPTYTYTDPGVYTVKLTASGTGGSDIETKIAYVEVLEEVIPEVTPTMDLYITNPSQVAV